MAEKNLIAERNRRLALGLALGAIAGLIVKDLNLPSLVSYWRPRGPIVPAIAIAFALLAATPLHRLLRPTVIALAALWLLLAFTPIVRALAPLVMREDTLTNADAIVVFASSLQRDGDPGVVEMQRLHHGIELLAEKRARRLVITELPAPDNMHAPLARAWLTRLGVDGDLEVVGPVWNTHDEGVLIGRLCRERGWHRVIAVTSPTHARRAAAVLERERLEVISSPSTETRFDLPALESSDDRIVAASAVLHDLVGLWSYRLKGWID